MDMTNNPAKSSIALLLSACTLVSCGHSRRSTPVRQGPRPLTSLEARAVGCYRLLAPVRDVRGEFRLLARHGRGSGPEQLGRLLRPPDPYYSSYWAQARADTLELVWTTTRSDSTGTPGVIIFWDALRARVALAADTLRGRATWGADVMVPDAPTVFDFRAGRTACPDSVPR